MICCGYNSGVRGRVVPSSWNCCQQRPSCLNPSLVLCHSLSLKCPDTISLSIIVRLVDVLNSSEVDTLRFVSVFRFVQYWRLIVLLLLMRLSVLFITDGYSYRVFFICRSVEDLDFWAKSSTEASWCSEHHYLRARQIELLRPSVKSLFEIFSVYSEAHFRVSV